MAQQLTEILSFFLDRFLQEKKGKCLSNTVAWDNICYKAPAKVLETGLIDEKEYKVEGSVGASGNWADVPWLAIFRKKITTTATKGVYIVYLLSADASAIYLTLNQGVTDPIKNANPYLNDIKKEGLKKSKRIIIQENVKAVSDKIDQRHFLSDGKIFLIEKRDSKAKDYERGTIFYKKYVKGALPTEELLQKDLKEMLEIYEEFYDKFYKDPNLADKKDFDNEGKELKKMAAVNMNMIFFGAPGTGKSHKIDYDLFKDEDGNSIGKGIKEIPENRKFRTTFHPDYDYAQFVGAYKPKKEANTITYSFVPQVFAKAYATAWTQYINAGKQSTADNQVYLVIEEINRGNCAQIFGDIFQLLDRDDKGSSQYSIDADCDFAEWLAKYSDLSAESIWPEYEKKVGEGKLKLPSNLNILATMNTSDQSLFPMDSAFKRRFDWEYVPISFKEKEAASYKIDVRDSKGNRYLWKDFVENVNKRILDLTYSEDKQLGEFFIKPDKKDENGERFISVDRFLGKVMFYLWNEVCKDEHKNGSFFQAKDESGKVNYFTFQDLYRDAGLLKRFMDELLEDKTGK